MEQEFSPIMPDEVRVGMGSSDLLTDLDIWVSFSKMNESFFRVILFILGKYN